MALERTFSIIKPDATRRNLTGKITAMLEDAGLRVIASKRLHMTKEQAEGFYAVHKERPFFNDLVAFMISFFPISVSIAIGLSTLEPEYRDILRSLGASRLTVFWKIALPKTLPEFFGALKVAVTLAFIGTNLVEIVAPHGRGLGSLFDSGRIASNYPLMFAVLIALAVLGILLYYIVVALERIFAGWAERRPT